MRNENLQSVTPAILTEKVSHLTNTLKSVVDTLMEFVDGKTSERENTTGFQV